MKKNLVLATLTLLILQGCASGPSIPMETDNQVSARNMCEAFSDIAKVSAERRDQGYPKEQTTAVVQKQVMGDIATGMLDTVYGDGAKLPPQQLKSMARHSCMDKFYKK